MKTQIEELSIIEVLKNTTLVQWVFLLRPTIYYLFSRRRDLSAYSAIDFSAIVFILYSFVAFIVSYKIIFGSKNNFGKKILSQSPIAIFMIYCALSFISMLWSVNPILTGFRTFECISMTLIIVAVVQQLFEKCNLKYIFVWSLLFCTWDIAWSLMSTMKWTFDISWLLQSSQMTATIFFFMALYLLPLRWYNNIVLVMSIFSMSTVSYIGMALGSISAFFSKGYVKYIAIVAGFIVLLATVAVGPEKFIKETIFFDKESVSLSETTGRDHLMDATIECVKEHPFGLGFFAAEPYVLYSKHLGAISAHNSLFSAGMGLGIPGILLISLFLISTAFVMFPGNSAQEYLPILIGCFCVAFIQCMGNPSVGSRVYGAWIPCMYIFSLISGFFIFNRFYEFHKED